jgi:GDPmannose 4,6-dehydratase
VRRAFITGISGQDGSYLAEMLIEKGYEVHGLVRASGAPFARLKRLLDDAPERSQRLFLHHGNMEDAASLRTSLNESAPDEIYHLASQTHVGHSFAQIEATCQVITMGTLRLLEIARQLRHPTKVFHASSSEIFGRPETSPQDEHTSFRPVTPYGCAKVFATQIISIYRQLFGLFTCNGILYNHESPRRGESFVTQKICRAAVAIKEGRQQELKLGNLTARRDWGDARDYVRGMWLALQHPTPEDFVFATGELHSVEDVLNIAFDTVNLDWRKYVRQDPILLRPEDPAKLVGNPSKAHSLLGWKTHVTFQQLIREMTAGAAGEPHHENSR